MYSNIFILHFFKLPEESRGSICKLWWKHIAVFLFCSSLFLSAFPKNLSHWDHIRVPCPVQYTSAPGLFYFCFPLRSFNFMPVAHLFILLSLMNTLAPVLKLLYFLVLDKNASWFSPLRPIKNTLVFRNSSVFRSAS